ncbi:MAG: glycosyltransferase family 4 protein, partial [Parcubacteria group bacterium]|nr:glycosyltransferase family 4 protein [Parcubacteria group bacterium]
NANAITTVSGNTRSRFLKIFGKGYSKNFHIIPGGIDMKMFPAQPNKSAIKKIEKKYKIEGKKVVLFCGRLTSEKGAKYLISAAKDIQGEVLIVGDGPERQFLNEMISRKNLKNVHLLGYMTHEKIIDLYYRADVFVAPSVVEEALGLSILEAMAARTPVIATRKGGIPLLVKQNHNGLFVKPRNSEKISNACNKLINDDNLRKKMGEAARKTVEEKFTWDKSGIKFNRLYKNITGLNGKNGKNGKNGHHKK